MAGCAPATWACCTQGELYISGRAKEIIFVNGQNYYPHDLEAIAQRAAGPGARQGGGRRRARRAGAQTEQLVVFVLHRGELEEFLPLATQVARLINEQTGLEVGARGAGEAHPQDHQRQDPAPPARGELSSTANSTPSSPSWRRCARRSAGPQTGSRSGDRGEAARRSAMRRSPGKRIDVNDNLFEIGASSLKLIEIHEQIDREYPGQVDLTELFDFPTIAELAAHLQGKLAAT